AQHIFYEWLRQKYPRRWQLKNRLRYLLTHQSGLALWEGKNSEWLAGLAIWSTQKLVTNEALQRLRQSPQSLVEEAFPQKDVQRLSLSELVRAIFDRLDGPVELDELVGVVAQLWGIDDRIISIEGGEQGSGRLHERWLAVAETASS